MTWAIKNPDGVIEVHTCQDGRDDAISHVCYSANAPWSVLEQIGYRAIEVKIVEITATKEKQ